MNETNNTKYIEEDEIDLRELFNTILKYKYKIAIFVFVVTSLTLVYALSIPNSYKSNIILSPQDQKENISGGLSSLASLAGVNLGGGSSKDPSVMMETLVKDYSFNKYVIEKYDLVDKIENQNNLVFALGLDTFYNIFNSKNEEDERTEEEKVFNTIQAINSIISVSSDKKTSMINLSVELNDRYLAKELVDIYLKELIEKIKHDDMKEISKQIEYYNKELESTYDVSLKEQLSKSILGLMQKRVFSQANDYYIVSKVVDSRVAYIKEKSKPKRALILVVSFVTSIILGIFLAFFMEFLGNNKKEKIE